MPATAFHKGEFVPLSEAKVGVMTHALHYGSGVFEGIRGNWNEEKQKIFIFRLREHYQRLLAGCQVLRIKLPHSLDELCKITVEMVERSGYAQDIYIRPIAYKGTEKVANLNLLDLDDAFTVFAVPFGSYLKPDAPLRCCTSPWRRIDDTMIPPRVKICGLYMNSVLAKTDAIAAGFDEAILLTQDGHVCEGTGENIFFLKGNVLVTPSIEDNALPGLTRDTIIQLAHNELGMETVERRVDRSELFLADEVFLTGTAAHLTPVGEVDSRKIGDGGMGPVTRKLQKMYFDVVQGRNSKYLHLCTPATPRLVKT